MAEQWKDIDDYEDYQISSSGNVISTKRGNRRQLVPFLNTKGYLFVNLCKNGKKKNFFIHRLVARAFLPNPENKTDVNHLDGNPLNNHLENLEWATRKENMQHAYAIGLAHQGSDRSDAKLNNSQVIFIRENLYSLSCDELAKKFNVSKSAIIKIQLGKTYKNASGIIRDKFDYRVVDEIRDRIRAEYVFGSSEFGLVALAKKYGVSHTTISNIIHE